MSSVLVKDFRNLSIEVRKLDNGRVQIIQNFEDCIPCLSSLGPKDLNNKYYKLVHSAVTKKLKPYFYEGTGMYRFDAGFHNVPRDLLDELLSHLEHSNKLN